MLFGVGAALGAAFALGARWEVAFIGFLLAFPLVLRPVFTSNELLRRLAIAFIFFLLSLLYTFFSYSFPESSTSGIKGEGVFNPSSVSLASHSFGKRWVYQGTLSTFRSETDNSPLTDIKNIPITIALSEKQTPLRPLAISDYVISGILKSDKRGKFILQPSRGLAWTPKDNTWSAAEIRYRLKQSVAKFIEEHYQSPQSQSFLTGIATGNFDDRQLSRDFGRFGLQHIMAISGFHFSIIACFFSLFLRLFLPKRIAILALVFMLTSYFLFLGTSASIMRAWAMCLIGCLGFVFERKPYATNSLGIALLFVLLVHPLYVQSLAFQFSFGITAAILLLFSPIDQMLQAIFLKRSLHQAFKMPLIDRHAYILLSFIRQGLALTMAVNLIALPITLFYFQKFPWMSLIFNLFFPFLVSISMILFLLGIGFSFLISPLGSFIHELNDSYTLFILNFTTYTPKAFDIYLRTAETSSWLPIIVVSLVFFCGIYLSFVQKEKLQRQREWVFI